MLKYFYFWCFYITISACWYGYKYYKILKEDGYDKIWFESTGERIEYYGGFKETLLYSFISALGKITSPIFLVIETMKFIITSIIIYLIN